MIEHEQHAALESLARQAADFNVQGEALAGSCASISAEIAQLGGQVADCRVQSSHAESAMAEITARMATIDETFAARSELIERLADAAGGRQAHPQRGVGAVLPGC